jgi:hypothetical protein
VNRRTLPAIVVVAAAVAYPLGVLAGGAPRFPTRAECVRPARAGGALDAVFARFDTQSEAEALLRRVLGLGFRGSQVEPDGCGRLKVVLHGIPSVEVGRRFVAEARSVGLAPTLEATAP